MADAGWRNCGEMVKDQRLTGRGRLLGLFLGGKGKNTNEVAVR